MVEQDNFYIKIFWSPSSRAQARQQCYYAANLRSNTPDPAVTKNARSLSFLSRTKTDAMTVDTFTLEN
jgi:hypothetical protein